MVSTIPATEFLGESRIALRRVENAQNLLSESERLELLDVLRQRMKPLADANLRIKIRTPTRGPEGTDKEFRQTTCSGLGFAGRLPESDRVPATPKKICLDIAIWDRDEEVDHCLILGFATE
jgi:hypothetical protein